MFLPVRNNRMGIKLISDSFYPKASHQYFAKRQIRLHETIWFVSFATSENKFDA